MFYIYIQSFFDMRLLFCFVSLVFLYLVVFLCILLATVGVLCYTVVNCAFNC